MRVLYVCAAGVLGGAERVTLDLCASLQRVDPAIALGLLAPEEGGLTERARALGVEVEVVPMPAGVSALGDSGLRFSAPRAALNLARRSGGAALQLGTYASRLGQAIARFRPSVVHTHGNKMHVLSALVGRGGAPLVWHLHDLISERPMIRRALRLLAFRARAAVAISEAVARDGRQVLGRLPVRVVLNAVDTGHFTPAAGDGARLDVLARLPPAPEGTLRVGLVATFARWKGQAVFLEAARKALDAGPATPLRFYVVGGPVYRTMDSQFSLEELRAQVERLGLSGYVGFVPFQQDPRDAYRALDIVAHASTRPEPFGLTIIEALACGRPTVVSAGGGAAELFTEGRDALGFAPGDVEGLARRVLELAASPELRERLSRNARASAVERFSRERLGQQMLAIYRSLPGAPDRA